jgi:hypothetical protein
MGLAFNDKCPVRDRGDMEEEAARRQAETRVVRPQAKDYQQPPKAGKGSWTLSWSL